MKNELIKLLRAKGLWDNELSPEITEINGTLRAVISTNYIINNNELVNLTLSLKNQEINAGIMINEEIYEQQIIEIQKFDESIIYDLIKGLTLTCSTIYHTLPHYLKALDKLNLGINEIKTSLEQGLMNELNSKLIDIEALTQLSNEIDINELDDEEIEPDILESISDDDYKEGFIIGFDLANDFFNELKEEKKIMKLKIPELMDYASGILSELVSISRNPELIIDQYVENTRLIINTLKEEFTQQNPLLNNLLNNKLDLVKRINYYETINEMASQGFELRELVDDYSQISNESLTQGIINLATKLDMEESPINKEKITNQISLLIQLSEERGQLEEVYLNAYTELIYDYSITSQLINIKQVPESIKNEVIKINIKESEKINTWEEMLAFAMFSVSGKYYDPQVTDNLSNYKNITQFVKNELGIQSIPKEYYSILRKAKKLRELDLNF